ncbi:MAG: hypothetical protein AB1422_15330 [bacterium]
MTIENINVDVIVKRVKRVLKEERELSSSVKSIIKLLAIVVTLLGNR